MKYLLVVLYSFCSTLVLSQTVLNPSLEVKDQSNPGPDNLSINNALDWYMTYNSSDWLSVENNYQNHLDYDPHSGTGHAGLGGMNSNGNPYREFITGTVTGLVAGQEYNFTCFVRSNGPADVLQKVGVYFSTTIPTEIQISPTGPYQKQIQPQIEQVVPISNDYNQISGCFTPSSSGTYYFTIGAFDNYDSSLDGQLVNYIVVDDADMTVSNANTANPSLIVQSEYCTGQIINIDGTASSNYDSYEWVISNTNESIIYYTSGQTAGLINNFNATSAMFTSGNFFAVGCYKVTLRLYNNGGCPVETSSNFCVVVPPSFSIFDNGEPHCEGTPFNIQTDGPSQYEYTWSSGESGIGLTSIDPVANTTITTYSVQASNPNAPGCAGSAALNVIVHTNNNQAPSFLNPPEKLYVQMGETVCAEFYSTDALSEDVSMILNYTQVIPAPNNLTITPNLLGEPLVGQNSNHGNYKWCFEFLNFNDYGEYTIPIVISDNNVCAEMSTQHNLIIDVLCPSCPEILYVDYRNESHYPFIGDEIVDAASEIYVGTIDQQPGHEVNTEDHHIVFTAQDVAIGSISGTNFEIYTSINSCSEICLDCCSDEAEFTYDPLPFISLLSPNDDGIDEVFYLSDLEHQFNAYNATKWRFEVWPQNDFYDYWDSYPPLTKLYIQESLGIINHPFSVCKGFETPTAQHPFETFYWDGKFNNDAFGNAYGESDFYGPGTPADPGMYRYKITLNGCEDNNNLPDHPFGHLEEIIGYIFLENINLKNQEVFDTSIVTKIQNLEAEFLERDKALSFNVRNYPNPTKGILNFEIYNGQNMETFIEVSDLRGKVVWSEIAINEGSIDLSFLESGIYYVTYRNGFEFISNKIVLH